MKSKILLELGCTLGLSASAQGNARADERQTSSDAQAENANLRKEQAQADTATAQTNAAKARTDMVVNTTADAAAVGAAQADADRARQIAQQAQQGEHQAISDKAAMRAQLSEQLNKILETRDSARGLIVSMSDVLFDTGRYTLKPGAREKLAKVAGIDIANPGLNIEVGGCTDNVGADDLNQKLSENRAGAVRGYLVEEGVTTGSVTQRALATQCR